MNSRIENYFADPKTRNRRILLFAVITVLLSRALIALVHVWYVSKYGGTGWWVTDLNAWDSAWYRSIVMEGYALEPSPGRSEVNWAFFPLLPMIVRGLYQLTGMEPYIIAMLVDTLFLMGIVIVGFVGAAYFDTWQWFNLSNTWLCSCTSFSYVLLRLIASCYENSSAPSSEFVKT